MTTVTLAPPKPVTALKPHPALAVRGAMLADIASAFGMPPDQLRILQDGYFEKLVYGITVKGVGYGWGSE